MMYSILYRSPDLSADKKMTTSLYETDVFTDAFLVLRGAVVSHAVELIDYSPSLDGALDVLLKDVRLFDDEPVKAAA